MKFTLLFSLIHAVTLLFVVQSNGQLQLPPPTTTHGNGINPSRTNLTLKKDNLEASKKERIFLGDDSLTFGYANAKFSLGGGFNGLGGTFGGFYRPNFYGHHHLGGGGFYGGGNFGGIGFGLGGVLPYKLHHHHHHKYHQYHHAFGGFGGYQHQPFFPGFGYY